MYKMIIKGERFTIPKQNLRLFAMLEANDLKLKKELNTDEQVIEFLKTIGIEVLNDR